MRIPFVKSFVGLLTIAVLLGTTNLSVFAESDADAVDETCCAYPNMETEREMVRENAIYESIDEFRHKVTGTAEDSVLCYNCSWGDNIPVPGEVTMEEEHEFADGVCEYCGYACLHPDTVLNVGRDIVSYEQLDGGYHNQIFRSYEVNLCKVCRVQQGDKRPAAETGSEKDFHYFDEDGECLDCGYSGECAHVNSNTRCML